MTKIENYNYNHLIEKNDKTMTQYNSIFNKIVVIITMAAISMPMAAQNIRTAYFMDNATHRHQLNPALQNRTGYVSIPALGALQVGVGTNTLSVGNLFTPSIYGNNPVTFLHSSVDANTFLNTLKDNNHINLDFSMPILSAGFYTKVGYFTFDVSAKGYAGTSLPKGLFEFAKLGLEAESGQTYNFGNLNINGSAYTDVAVGYSRVIDQRLTVGGKAKVLLGLADMQIRYDDVNATLTEDLWSMTARGSADIAMKGLTAKYNSDNKIDGFDHNSQYGIAGIGFGVDLGATYKTVDLFDGITGDILDNMTFSAAIIDLGFINWSKSNAIKAIANGDTFEFDGFDLDFADDSDVPSIEDQLSDLGNDLGDIFNFTKVDPTSRTRMLRATLNLGAEYAILNDKISFGLLSSTRFGAPHTWSELTLSSNFQPVRWFGATLSYSFIHSKFQTFGWALNFSPKGINFFIGSDYMLTNVSPQYVPLTNALNFNFGLSVPLSGNTAKN